jgi:pimeloyl-ACP methyl ester carboxylesterase
VLTTPIKVSNPVLLADRLGRSCGVILLILGCQGCEVSAMGWNQHSLQTDRKGEMGDCTNCLCVLRFMFLPFFLFFVQPNADALTLVLLHGFSGSLANFNNVWAPLAKDNQILAFDRPGWGLSARVRVGVVGVTCAHC